MGPAVYDFGAAGLFFSCGDPSPLGRLLRAYGYPAERLDHALAQRLLALTLLHRHSNFPWYFQRLPLLPSVHTLSELALRWWGTE